MSEPPPIPVAPTSTPTPKPNTTIAGSISSGEVEAALDAVGAGPAAFAPRSRRRAVRAPDRGEALVVQWVVRDVVRGDVAPDVLVGPVRQRGGLVLAVARVPAQLRRSRAARRLIAPEPGDPRVDLRQRALQRHDLAHPAAGVGIALPQPVDPLAGVAVDRDPVALLDAPPGHVGLLEQDARVEHEEPRLRLDPHEHVEDHRRLLLERAGH